MTKNETKILWRIYDNLTRIKFDLEDQENEPIRTGKGSDRPKDIVAYLDTARDISMGFITGITFYVIIRLIMTS